MTTIPFEPFRQIALGPVMIQTFGLLVATGIAVAYVAAGRHIRRQGLDAAAFESLFLWTILGGFVGARLLYVALNAQLFANPVAILKVWQGGLWWILRRWAHLGIRG